MKRVARGFVASVLLLLVTAASAAAQAGSTAQISGVVRDTSGAVLQTPLAGHDIDAFDDFCEHLMVCDADKGVVIGTYRLLTPTQALRAGGRRSSRGTYRKASRSIVDHIVVGRQDGDRHVAGQVLDAHQGIHDAGQRALIARLNDQAAGREIRRQRTEVLAVLLGHDGDLAIWPD